MTITPAFYRLAFVIAFGIFIVVMTMMSRTDRSCDWNSTYEPSYYCAQVTR